MVRMREKNNLNQVIRVEKRNNFNYWMTNPSGSQGISSALFSTKLNEDLIASSAHKPLKSFFFFLHFISL